LFDGLLGQDERKAEQERHAEDRQLRGSNQRTGVAPRQIGLDRSAYGLDLAC
jgi:hypothetical protein